MIKPNQSRNNSSRIAASCCPCTNAYNISMEHAAVNAAINSVGCGGVGLPGTPIMGLVCELGTIATYSAETYFAMAQWEACMG